MKTNEAPEKIYVANNVFPSHVDWDGSPINTKRIDDHDIEYTRTDAFIEKAEKFLKDNLTEKECKFSWGDWTKVKSGDTPIASFMRVFRNYMKGE